MMHDLTVSEARETFARATASRRIGQASRTAAYRAATLRFDSLIERIRQEVADEIAREVVRD